MTNLVLRRPGALVPRFDRFLADVRRWGWVRSLFIRLLSALQRYAGFYVWRVGLRPLVRHPPAPDLPSGIALRVARPEELLDAALDPELDMHPGFVRDALARGDVAFGAFDGDRLVSYSWRSFTAAPHCEGLWAAVDPPYFLGYKAFTRPSYRGKRIYGAVVLFSDAFLLERGYTAEVGFVEPGNLASLAVARSLGRRRIGYVGYVTWFGRPRPCSTPAARRIGARLLEVP